MLHMSCLFLAEEKVLQQLVSVRDDAVIFGRGWRCKALRRSAVSANLGASVEKGSNVLA